METSILNANSLHPTLSLSISASLLTVSHSNGCVPHALVHLPPGILYDPFTADNAIITHGRSAARGYEVSYLASEIELEKAVGWTSREAAGRRGKQAQAWERVDPTPGEEEDDEVGMQDLMQQVLMEEAEKFLAEKDKTRIRNRAKAVKRKEERDATQGENAEVSSIQVMFKVNELLSADGGLNKPVEVQLPLHLRYQRPSSSPADPALPSLASTYLTLLNDIAHAPNDSMPVSLTPPPVLYVACSSISTYIQGFQATTLGTVYPSSHAHLRKQRAGTHILTYSSTPSSRRGLTLNVPVPKASVLPAVHFTTLATVVASALAVVYHLLANVVPALDAVEKTL